MVHGGPSGYGGGKDGGFENVALESENIQLAFEEQTFIGTEMDNTDTEERIFYRFDERHGGI